MFVNDTEVELPAENLGSGSGGSGTPIPAQSSTFPGGTLTVGENTIRFIPGANSYGPDRVYVSDFRVVLDNGRVLVDPVTEGHQVDVGTDRQYPEEYAFTVTVTEGDAATSAARWDTTTVDDGPYLLTLTDDNGATTATVTVDNLAPVINVTALSRGARFRDAEITIDVTATDVVDGDVEVGLVLDGRPVANGDVIASNDLGTGSHELVATATDSFGRVTTETVSFETLGDAPDAPTSPLPADGATDVPAQGLELSVQVFDAGGDALDVEFRRALPADEIVATTGSSIDGAPAVGAGAPADAEAVAAADDVVLTTSEDAAYPFQQFEVTVPEGAGAEVFDIAWTGSVPQGQFAELSAWNHTESEWVVLGRATGTGAPLTLTARSEAGDFARDGKATVQVQNRPAHIAPSQDGVTNFAWMTDTQHYARANPEVFNAISQWIVDHTEPRKLAYTVHTGDIVNTTSIPVEWERADAALQILDDAGMPYGVVAGNHDYERDMVNYRANFGEERYAHHDWYMGTVDDNVQSYSYLSTPEADFLVVFLTWAATPAQWQWVKDVIAAHPDANVIVGTHEQFDVEGNLVGQGKRLMDEIILPFDNVDMILSGHKNTSYVWVHRLADDRTVLQSQANYNGDGFFRTLSFDARADTVTTETYSVLVDRKYRWLDTECSSLTEIPARGIEMTDDCIESENYVRELDINGMDRVLETDHLEVTFAADEVLGSVDAVASGERAAVAVEVEAGQALTWYATATNEGGHSATSEAWTLSTAVGASPTPEPTEEPTPDPTQEPTPEPTDEPTPEPTATVTVTAGPTPTTTVTVTPPTGDLYETPGFHHVNGRSWMTTCEPYSATTRCFTYIWATQVQVVGGHYVQTHTWAFNNLTYLPSGRAMWSGNPLGNAGEWVSDDGRAWRTECDTAVTGRNGCRSYLLSTVHERHGDGFRTTDRWVFNNMVRFS